MKITNVEQGTPVWLAWRKSVITATDCPAIMGSSPWSTAYKCWQRKLDLIPEQETNAAMERGKRLEPKARAQFIQIYGINMTPVCVESTEYEFLGASLDGISDCRRYILEIKCGGQKLIDMAIQGIIPEYYNHQIQLQLLITGAEKCYYYVYDGEQGYCIIVFPDRDFTGTFKDIFIPKAREFWKCVALQEQPALQDSDYADMSEDNNWKRCAIEYKLVCDRIKKLEELKESCRTELLTLCKDHNSKGHGIKIMKNIVRGRVSYDAIPELKDLDLNKYRKSSTTCWKILES